MFSQGFRWSNWWIGGASISNVYGEPQLIYTADLHDVVLGMSGTHDSFNLRQVDVRKNSPIQHVFVLMLENHSFKTRGEARAYLQSVVKKVEAAKMILV